MDLNIELLSNLNEELFTVKWGELYQNLQNLQNLQDFTRSTKANRDIINTAKRILLRFITDIHRNPNNISYTVKSVPKTS